MQARAFWTVAPGAGELRTETLPPRAPDQALVRTRASGISRGTERLVFTGRVPETQWQAMRCPLQDGAFPAAVKYGYSAVGLVEDGPGAGQRVFVLHPHQDLFLAPAAMCVPVPETVPDHRAVLGANMETALNIAWDAAPLPGERVLVIGAGVVGLLAAFLFVRIPGVRVTVCDLDASRRAVAESLGAAFCAPEDAPGEQELILHASASAAGLRLALARAANEARILEASWFGAADIPLPLGEAFHARRLRLVSTQVGQIGGAMRGRRTYAERLSLALSLLDVPALDALVGPVTRFDDLPAAMPALLGLVHLDGPAPLCPLVTYP